MPKFKIWGGISLILLVILVVMATLVIVFLDKPLTTVYYDCRSVLIDPNAPKHLRDHCERKRHYDNR